MKRLGEQNYGFTIEQRVINYIVEQMLASGSWKDSSNTSDCSILKRNNLVDVLKGGTPQNNGKQKCEINEAEIN